MQLFSNIDLVSLVLKEVTLPLLVAFLVNRYINKD